MNSQERKTKGLCVGCGNKREEPYALCLECRKKRRDKYHNSIKNGMCGYCHKEPIEEGFRVCPACRKRNFSENKKPSILKKRKEKRYAKELAWRNSGICPTCGKNPKTESSVDCEICKGKRLHRNRNIAITIAEAYGGKCNCCGEPNRMFLSIDHINNDGKSERSPDGKYRVGSTWLYKKLVNQGFPKDRYQLLCYNCNIGKYKNNGICPHKTISTPH